MEINEDEGAKGCGGEGVRHPRADHWEFAIADIIDRSNTYLGQEIPPALVGILGARILTHLNHEFEAGRCDQKSVPPVVAGGLFSLPVNDAVVEAAVADISTLIQWFGYAGCGELGIGAEAMRNEARIQEPKLRNAIEVLRSCVHQHNAAEMEHAMAAAEWAVRETELKEVIEAGNNACREIAEQRDAEERSRIWISDRHNASALRCAELEQALAATGVYLAGLKIYDEDPTARRIVERNLELLRNGTGAQGSGVGEERATCGKCGATVVEAAAGVTVGDKEQGIGDSEEADETPSFRSMVCEMSGHVWAIDGGNIYCVRCRLAGTLSDVPNWVPGFDVPPEGRTTNAERPRQGLEHVVAVDGREVPLSPTGDDYNTVAARLREGIPISDPIWQESNGKSIPGAIHPDAAVGHVSRTIPLVDNLNHLRHRLQNAVDWFAHLREQNTLLFTSTEQADNFRVDLGGMTQALKTIKAINPVDFPPPNTKQSKDDETATARLERLREAYLMVRRAEGGQWAAYPGAHEVFRKALVEVFGAIPPEGGTTNADPI